MVCKYLRSACDKKMLSKMSKTQSLERDMTKFDIRFGD